jgi:hypothetical protein
MTIQTIRNLVKEIISKISKTTTQQHNITTTQKMAKENNLKPSLQILYNPNTNPNYNLKRSCT